MVMPVTQAEKDFFNEMVGSYWVDMSKLNALTDDDNEVIAKENVR